MEPVGVGGGGGMGGKNIPQLRQKFGRYCD